ncbi:hypothetical protein [Microbacterium thalassium]|uniref:Uncharacterized protein n=1 Tax=Microbacterium thalassium TaxID=362649 RepID=A0A7X0FRW9_9MICO|nr:hypothetical protein [Microbacterium thalassium]MBB6391916.1 hypothetical protein [Microbacterium thalassium]GLK23936.1 hypothetical protein GCM10017607_12540 [Microbacterium thalassium]
MTTTPAAPKPAPEARGGNVAGRMTALTLFTPIRRQWTWALRLGFAIVPYLPVRRHIIQFNFIKFVRWVIVDDLDGEKLHYPYLFFESNFDGPWQHYIDAFAYVIPADIRFVWGRGPGFPGPPPAEPLKAWIAHNSMEGGTYYCAHEDLSTRQIQHALSVTDAFEKLQRDARGMSPAEFGQAWRSFLTDQQSHL